MSLRPKRILFICLGNIVRSPLAQALFEQYAEKSGMSERFQVDSAGTGSWHSGEAPDQRMQLVARRKGFVYTHRARQVLREDFEQYDLLIAMDEENFAYLKAAAQTLEQRQKLHLLREWDAYGSANASVPDPYYDHLNGFEEVYGIIDRSVQTLFENLASEDNELPD